MGNTCFSTRTHDHEVKRKFSKGVVLIPCKKHFYLTYDKKGRGKTALIDGPLTCVTSLVEAGADVNEKNSTLSTLWGEKYPLHCHPRHLGPAYSDNPEHGSGHYQCIKLLIEVGTDVNVIDNYGRLDSSSGRTPLHYAVLDSHHKCVKLFIQAGADVNHVDNKGYTTVMQATFNGRFKCPEVLVEAGADVNKPDLNGCTPLQSVAENGHDKCLKFLFESGTNISTNGSHGHTALALAA